MPHHVRFEIIEHGGESYVAAVGEYFEEDGIPHVVVRKKL